jgi:outer membrane protein TolC
MKHPHKLPLLFGYALLLLAAPPALADTLDLSLADAVALALRESPARIQSDVTRASGTVTLIRGIAGLVPTPTASASWTPDDSVTPWSAALTLNQVIFSPSAFLGVATAAVRSGSQSLSARDARARLVYDATVDYLALLRAAQLRDVAQAELERARVYLDLVTEQRRLGVVSAIELLRAQVRESQARIDLLSAENGQATAVEQFKATAGLGRQTFVRATDTLEQPSDFAVGNPDSLERAIERRSATARLARNSSALAGLGLAASLSEIVPEVDWQWRSVYSGDRFPTSASEWKANSAQSSGISAGVSLNPKSYILDAADAILETRGARAALRAAQLQVHANAVTAVRNYTEARARYELADATLRLNRQLHELGAEQLRLGTISRVDYLDVESGLVGAQSAWVNAVCDTYVKAAQIAYLLGRTETD